MNIAQKLYQLQELELEIESNEQSLSRCTSQLGEGEALTRARAKLLETQQRLGELKQEQHSLEREIEDIGAKIAAVGEALYSGRVKNPKELAGFQQEEKGLGTQRDRLEERVLDIMEQAELVTAGLANINSELETLEGEWHSQQQKLSAEIERLKKLISEFKEKQQLVLAGIDSKMADYYYQLKKQKGWAVARVEQGTCRGCRISLSTAELQRARGEQLVECNSCRRILYLG
jgi:hypothetical protein